METMKAIYLVKVLLKTIVLTAAFPIIFTSTVSAQSESNNPVTYDTTITEHANNEADIRTLGLTELPARKANLRRGQLYSPFRVPVNRVRIRPTW